MHELEFTFFVCVPGNPPAFAYYGKKIFSRNSRRMNFLRIARGIDDAPDAAKRPKAIETVALVGHRQREDAVFLQERIAIIEKPNQIGGVFEHMRPDDPVVNVTPTDELGVRPAVPNEINLLDVFDIHFMQPKNPAFSV